LRCVGKHYFDLEPKFHLGGQADGTSKDTANLPKATGKNQGRQEEAAFLLGSECRVILKEMHWLVLLRVILFEMIMQCFSLCFSFFLLHSIKFDSKEVFSLSQRC
jgi:hypothetical protein